MATSFVNVGSIANDGTGDPIRTAFITVNENFNIINGAILQPQYQLNLVLQV